MKCAPIRQNVCRSCRCGLVAIVLMACSSNAKGIKGSDTAAGPASGTGRAAMLSGSGGASFHSGGSGAGAPEGRGGTLASAGTGAGVPAGGGRAVTRGSAQPPALGNGGRVASVEGSSGTGDGSIAGGGAAGRRSDSGAMSRGPCDIYAADNTPCIAAHSTVRALLGAYAGSLYQVRRASDNTTRDIAAVAAGDVANAGAQDMFCAGTSCVVTKIYDQSGHKNDLEYQGEGSSVGGRAKPASATSESLNLNGNKVYALYINPGNSYWRDGHTTGVPTGSAPEGMYMVTSGAHVNGGCCFDYGNSETTRSADGAGSMDAIYFGTSCWFGGCSGSGPWIQADLEYGLYPGGSQQWNPKQQAFRNKYVTAVLKNNGTSRFALKGGDAQSGDLTTLWDGALPSGYSPMKKQGAIVLGSGGDCCARNTNLSQGTFYEGAIVGGYPSDETEKALQMNVLAAGYGR